MKEGLVLPILTEKAPPRSPIPPAPVGGRGAALLETVMRSCSPLPSQRANRPVSVATTRLYRPGRARFQILSPLAPQKCH